MDVLSFQAQTAAGDRSTCATATSPGFTAMRPDPFLALLIAILIGAILSAAMLLLH
jgi:hypothetical protein